MPTLNWIGKEAVVDHHRKVPLRLLECDAALSAGDPEAGNLLVQGVHPVTKQPCKVPDEGWRFVEETMSR